MNGTAAVVEGLGVYAPSRVVTNFDLAKFVDTSDEWITSRTGMKERRISHVTAVELSTVAAKRALACADLDPADAAEDYAEADTEIVASLPAILSRRQANRGIESIAVSPDERFIYFILQNPLANPDAATYRAARNTRLFKMEAASGALVAEYVYQLDDPQSFGLDPSDNQSAPRVSEMIALDTDRLLVLERTDGTTKLHEITLEGATDILGSAWDEAATSPSLEALAALDDSDIVPVEKTLRFDTARDFPEAPTKLEGIAILGDGSLALINDNDFGIRGEANAVVILSGAVTANPLVYAP